MGIQTKIDLSQYNVTQLDYFYEYGYISYTEYSEELKQRNFSPYEEQTEVKSFWEQLYNYFTSFFNR